HIAPVVSFASSLSRNETRVAMAKRVLYLAPHISPSSSVPSILSPLMGIYLLLIVLLISPIGGTRHHRSQLPFSTQHNYTQWESTHLPQNTRGNAQSTNVRWSTQSPSL